MPTDPPDAYTEFQAHVRRIRQEKRKKLLETSRDALKLDGFLTLVVCVTFLVIKMEEPQRVPQTVGWKLT